MSSCLIIQQENKCYIGSDTAVSCSIGDRRVRVGSNIKKTFVHDGKIIFCSGNMEMHKKVLNNIKSKNKLNINEFIMYLKKEYDKSIKSCNFEVFICEDIKNNIRTTQISSYNEFEPVIRVIPKGQVGVFAMGYNTDEIFNDSVEVIKNTKDISKIYIDVFNKNICNEIGGNLNLFELNNGIISEYEYELDDDTPTLFESFNETASLIMAKLLVGSVILGEKLYISSENGTFFIGNMEEKQGFGLSIKDGNMQQRIFLGTEVDPIDNIRKAKLRLLSKDGREVVLSEDGIIQTSQFLCWDNCSINYPMRIPYVCDEGVVSNKKILMTVILEKYRAFERGMSSGGALSTSSNGGGGTSGSGGGQTSSSGGGGTSSYEGGFNLNVFTGNGSFVNELATIQMAYYPSDYYIDGSTNSHGHTLDTGQIKHTHSVILKSDAHAHTVYDHTHQVYNHTHQVYDHTHAIDTTHNHNLEYSIHEQNSYCTNVRIYVNDVLVKGDINESTQVDITSYVKVNSTNNIRLETDTNGRITCNIFTKAFVGF